MESFTESESFRTAVHLFNAWHHSLFATLHGPLPQLVAIVLSSFLMATLIVLPCFFPLLVWASLFGGSSSSDTPQRAAGGQRASTEQRAPLLAGGDECDGAGARSAATAVVPPTPSQPSAWSVEEVCEWLREVELGQLADSFAKHGITGGLLFDLTSGEIASDLNVEKLADRKRLAAEIALLRRRSRWWWRWWERIAGRWRRRSSGAAGRAAAREYDKKRV